MLSTINIISLQKPFDCYSDMTGTCISNSQARYSVALIQPMESQGNVSLWTPFRTLYVINKKSICLQKVFEIYKTYFSWYIYAVPQHAQAKNFTVQLDFADQSIFILKNFLVNYFIHDLDTFKGEPYVWFDFTFHVSRHHQKRFIG